MPHDDDQGAKCARRWPLRLYAVIVTLIALPSIHDVWSAIRWPNHAQLVVVSPAQIDRVTVTYDGRPIERRPNLWGSVYGYAAYPRLLTRSLNPVLQVSWEGPSGPVTISRVMRQVDSGPVCLYVLALDSAGIPVAGERRDEHSPFWWSCSMR